MGNEIKIPFFSDILNELFGNLVQIGDIFHMINSRNFQLKRKNVHKYYFNMLLLEKIL